VTGFFSNLTGQTPGRNKSRTWISPKYQSRLTSKSHYLKRKKESLVWWLTHNLSSTVRRLRQEHHNFKKYIRGRGRREIKRKLDFKRIKKQANAMCRP
jgi:hypothetical protein